MADETICPKCNAQNPKDTVFCGKCGTKIPQSTAEHEAVDPLIGSFVGDRFLVHQKLGEGGMGVVYRAEQTAIKREVALKVLHANLTDESLFARFQNEAAAASRLNHPNTITIYDFGRTESNSLYIAMEFIKGISLDDEIRTVGAMPVGRVCHIGHQICGSLQDAHDNSIVHRDLKPENVMLCERAGETDVVKVLDFGIAKIVEDDGQDQRKALTKTGMVFGTPQYMSPEQIRGEKVDHRSDIYSLGVMLYQMLTGALPFSADTPMGLLTKHLMDTPEPLEPRGIPGEVAAAVMTALEKEADKRPESMRAFGMMLAKAGGIGMDTAQYAATGAVPKTEPQPTVPANQQRPPISRKQSGDKKAFPVVPVVILVLLLIGGGAAALYFTIGRKAAPVQPTATSPQTMAPPAQPAALAQLQPTIPQGTPTEPAPLPAANTKDTAGDNTAAEPSGGSTKKNPEKDKPEKKTPKKTPTKDVPEKKEPEKTPETPPDKTPPPPQTDPEPEKTDPDKPKKSVKCSFGASKGTSGVSKAIIKALKKREKGIRVCSEQTPDINTMIQFTVEKNAKKVSKIRAIRGGNDCIQKVFQSISFAPQKDGPSPGLAVFNLKKTGNILEKCKVSVRTPKDLIEGGLNFGK